MTVMRGIWVQDNNDPFEEKHSIEIERKHLELFKDTLLKSNESDVSFTLEPESAQTPEGNPSNAMTPTKSNKKDNADTQIERKPLSL